MAQKVAVDYVTTSANANQQNFSFSSIDTYQNQHVTGLHVGITTSGVTVFLIVAGDTKLSVDCTYFSAGNGFLPCDFNVPAQIPLTIGVQDIGGSGHTSLPVTIKYDVPQ